MIKFRFLIILSLSDYLSRSNTIFYEVRYDLNPAGGGWGGQMDLVLLFWLG